ncbi:MAG: hypothetical protein KJ823_03225, partial [Proteobacteria bacterium]|nr:hypothetical protein [Pseudomonadota bacterium]
LPPSYTPTPPSKRRVFCRQESVLEQPPFFRSIASSHGDYAHFHPDDQWKKFSATTHPRMWGLEEGCQKMQNLFHYVI